MTFRMNQSKFGRKSLIGLSIAALIITQGGCGNNDSKETVSVGEDFLLNTYCAITIYEAEKEALIKEAFSYARTLENALSRTVPTSEISAFNDMLAGEELEISKEAAVVIERGLAYGQISGGLFDITIGSLTELWDFSAANPVVPNSDRVQEAMLPVDYLSIKLLHDPISDTTTLTKEHSDTHIDLGAIAKGYIADKVAFFLTEEGVSSAIVNFGGNIVTLGSKQDGSSWVVGIEKPFSREEGETIDSRELVGTVSVNGGSIVTSGTYERKFYQDGTLYYHILDPKTGYPRQTDLMSVTIIGASSMDCDALSTTCLMLGLEKGKAFIENIKGYEAIFILNDGAISFTEGAGFTAY